MPLVHGELGLLLAEHDLPDAGPAVDDTCAALLLPPPLLLESQKLSQCGRVSHQLPLSLPVLPAGRPAAGTVLDLFCELNPSLKRAQLDTFCWARLWAGFYLNNAGGAAVCVQPACPPASLLAPAGHRECILASRPLVWRIPLHACCCSDPCVHCVYFPDQPHRLVRHSVLAERRQDCACAPLLPAALNTSSMCKC